MNAHTVLEECCIMERKAYWDGDNLAPDHRSMIACDDDRWKLSLIDNIPYTVQRDIGYAFVVRNEESRKHYAMMFAVWLHGEKHFLGERLRHVPTGDEVADDMLYRAHLGERFRLFYLLAYPEHMLLCNDSAEQRRMRAQAFLQRADEIAGECYLPRFFPYHELVAV